MKVRNYAKSIGFEVVGKLTYMGKRGLAHRWYMDEAGNKYFVNICIDDIEILPSKNGGKKMANEKRLIDANALSKSIKEGSGTELQKFFADVCVATAPTVDAVEVVHARWDKYIDDDGDNCCRCTDCGWRITYEDCTLEDLGYNYCPNCGAKMDGGANNE